jgi:hypothetical protein
MASSRRIQYPKEDCERYQRSYMKDSNVVSSRRKGDLLLGSNNRSQTVVDYV